MHIPLSALLLSSLVLRLALSEIQLDVCPCNTGAGELTAAFSGATVCLMALWSLDDVEDAHSVPMMLTRPAGWCWEVPWA